MNQLGICQKIEKGMDIGKAVPVDVLNEDVISAVEHCRSKRESKMSVGTPPVATITSCMSDEVRKAKLKEHLKAEETNGLTPEKVKEILSLLENYNDVFSLTEGER